MGNVKGFRLGRYLGESISPLQLSVYWRLALIYFINPFLFFLDIFMAEAIATTCRHNITGTLELPGTLPPNVQINQSGPAEGDADWWTESSKRHSVCGWTDWMSYGQTLFMIGMLLGTLFGGPISDRYGKRPVLLGCLCLYPLCGLVPIVLPQPLLFLLIRCVTGACCCCINITSFSLAVEWTNPKARLWPSAVLTFCFSLGTMAMGSLAWLNPTWIKLHLAVGLPQLICLPLFLSVPESPQWLFLRRRMDILERYYSNSPADKHCLDLLLNSSWSDLQKAAEAQEPPPGGHTPCDIIHLRHPTVLLRLFIMTYLSAVSSLTYYGICMNIGSFGVNVYSAQFFSGLSETPGLLIPLVHMGRRPLTVLTLFLSGMACFLSLLLSRYNIEPMLVMSLALLGKLCILATIFISILYCIELFPTVVRQRCMSLVNLGLRFGSLVNSLVPPNPNGAISLAAMVVYSSGPIVGCGLCLLLPETSGIPLPDSVEDCDRQPRPLPSLGTLCLARKLLNCKKRKPEVLPTEISNAQKQDLGLI